MSDYYKEYYQKNKDKILFRVKNNYMKKKFNKYEQPVKESNMIIKNNNTEEPKKEEEEVKDKIKKNIIVSFF
jgi:hypothetical protein